MNPTVQHSDFYTTLGSMRHSKPMLTMLQALAEHPESISDADIVLVWSEYHHGMRTNCNAAAEALMAALASICSHRSGMLATLLPDMLDPLVMLGMENASEVIDWALAFTKLESPYMGRPDALALNWISEDFATLKHDIQVALDALRTLCLQCGATSFEERDEDEADGSCNSGRIGGDNHETR